MAPPPEVTLAWLKGLIPPALAYDRAANRGGLDVKETRGGFHIISRGPGGAARNFTADEMKHLSGATFIDELARRVSVGTLGRMFGFTETIRMKQGLLGHRALLDNEWSAAVRGESLDPDPRRARIPPVADLLDPTKVDTLPRSYTYVRMQPEPPTRHVFFRELPLPKVGGGVIEPDELHVAYRMTDAELAQLRAHPDKPFLEVLRDTPDARRVTELVIHSGDINAPIHGDALATHFTKTMDGGHAALQHLIDPSGRFALAPEGRVVFRARDAYLKPLEYFVGDKAHVRRAAPKGRGARHVAMVYEAVFDLRNGAWQVIAERTNLQRLARALAHPAMQARTRHMTRVLRDALQTVARAAT